jgi:hypothetical protein
MSNRMGLVVTAAVMALAIGAPVLAQTTPETSPAERTQTPESARDPQVMVPETADDVDRTKEARDKAVKRGAVRSVTPPAKPPTPRPE